MTVVITKEQLEQAISDSGEIIKDYKRIRKYIQNNTGLYLLFQYETNQMRSLRKDEICLWIKGNHKLLNGWTGDCQYPINKKDYPELFKMLVCLYYGI